MNEDLLEPANFSSIPSSALRFLQARRLQKMALRGDPHDGVESTSAGPVWYSGLFSLGVVEEGIMPCAMRVLRVRY